MNSRQLSQGCSYGIVVPPNHHASNGGTALRLTTGCASFLAVA